MEGNNFLDWNFVKQKLDACLITNYCRERDIWVCAIGKNIGREQNGKRELFQRPVLVVKTFANGTFLGLPLTSSESNQKFKLQISGGSFILLSQLRIFDMRRVLRKTRMISYEEFEYLKSQIRKLFKSKTNGRP